MNNRIIVPLDGTEIGEAIFPKIEDLIIKTMGPDKTEITLLKVISKMNFNMLNDNEKAQLPISEEDMIQQKKEALEYLEKAGDTLRSKGIAVKTMVSFGSAAEEIVKAAREINANLIAMSTHGRSGVVRWAIGSVTDKVIRMEGKIPVLAVKANGKEENSVLPLGSLQSLVKHS